MKSMWYEFCIRNGISLPEDELEAAVTLMVNPISEIEEYLGRDTLDVLDDAEQFALDHADGFSDDQDVDFPENPVSDFAVIKGNSYRIGYSGVAGKYWREGSQGTYWG